MSFFRGKCTAEPTLLCTAFIKQSLCADLHAKKSGGKKRKKSGKTESSQPTPQDAAPAKAIHPSPHPDGEVVEEIKGSSHSDDEVLY